MKTADFDYALPEELIAQQPAARREESRLLVVHRASHTIEHRRFFELPTFLRAGDLLLRNTARVRPARLLARRRGGGRVECLLLRPDALSGPDAPLESVRLAAIDNTPHAGAWSPRLEAGSAQSGGSTKERWWCLLRPGRRLPPGAEFGEDGEFTAHVVEKSSTAEYLVEFTLARTDDSVAAMAERLGRVPLPPYIHRPGLGADDPAATEDRARYQTVFADRAHTVAVAAPTAGLHFSETLLARLAERGVEFADVVLHVGLGTFRPIETEDVAAHPIHRETIEIPAATQARLARGAAGRRIAVGTTAVRAVEHWAREMDASAVTHPTAHAGGSPLLSGELIRSLLEERGPRASVVRGVPDRDHIRYPLAEAKDIPQASPADFVAEADLFIHPPATFRVIDGLITNFHLPRSTLLCLVAAFLTPGSIEGAAWLREIYAEAMRERYRFLSYGDAMLIL